MSKPPEDPPNKTIAIYDANAATLAARYEAKAPEKTYALIAAHFQKHQPTVDIGAGSGRDTAYLITQGYPAIGIEASDGMLAEAARYHPGLTFRKDSLPSLSTLPDSSYTNLLSDAVLMHLEPAELAPALENILRVLAPQGRAVLRYRGPKVPEHTTDRQVTIFPIAEVTGLLERLGAKILHSETEVGEGVTWHYVVAEKPA